MKEHPILFSGEMVGAIREGRKTQTRRVIKPQPILYSQTEAIKFYWLKTKLHYTEIQLRENLPLICPYGEPGDRLWVREAWAPQVLEDGRKYRQGDPVIYRADFCGEALDYPWRPSIHMPRWASRITLEIVNVRVERLREISEMDAASEGCQALHIVYDNGPSYRDTFRELWNSLNAKRGYGWDVNPWVWVIEFKKVGEK